MLCIDDYNVTLREAAIFLIFDACSSFQHSGIKVTRHVRPKLPHVVNFAAYYESSLSYAMS